MFLLLLTNFLDTFSVEGNDNYLIPKSFTRVYPYDGWFKIVQYINKQAATISNIVDQSWLFRYLRLTIFDYDSEK